MIAAFILSACGSTVPEVFQRDLARSVAGDESELESTSGSPTGSTGIGRMRPTITSSIRSSPGVDAAPGVGSGTLVGTPGPGVTDSKIFIGVEGSKGQDAAVEEAGIQG